MNMTFHGAKLALFLGADIVSILRDDIEQIPFPDYWDLPGGGREGSELPVECALRETHEEVGLRIEPASVSWGKRFEVKGQVSWFFAAHLPLSIRAQIVFGDEGQRWTLMSPKQFMEHSKAVPHFAQRLGVYLSGVPGDEFERPPAV